MLTRVPRSRGITVNEIIQPQPDALPRDAAPRPQESATVEKLIHLALPVRLTHMRDGIRTGIELACTYDIHPRGARLLTSRNVKVGDLITVERGRQKSVCQVVWTADPDSTLRGQFGTFTRSDGVERVWEVSEPLLDNPPKAESYPQGSWGPPSVAKLVAPYHWHLS